MDNGASNHASFSAPRRWGILFNVALGVLALLAILVMANYLALRYPARLALTGKTVTQLRPQTLNLLKYMTNRIEITMFIEKRERADLHALMSALLEEYAHASELISVREIQPISDFSRTAAALAAYKFPPESKTNRNFVLVACGEDTQVINDDELAELDTDALLAQTSKEIGLKNFKGEGAISSAIFRLTNPRKIKAYFLRGQGEHDPTSDDPGNGYGQFATMLKKELNLEWDTVELVGTNEVPADCQLLIIAGPRITYQEPALKSIQSYLKSGGRALVMLSSLTRGGRTGIEAILEKWNVGVFDVVVRDPKFSPVGIEERELYVNYTPDGIGHPVTKPLWRLDETLRIRLVSPRIVYPMKKTSEAPEAPQVACLACTWKEGSYAIGTVENTVPRRNPASDLKDQAFPLIVAAEQGGIEGVRASRNTRLVVVGDSMCFANKWLELAGNPFFARLAVNWLVDRPRELLDALIPLPLAQHRIELSEDRWRSLNWLLLAGLPGGVLVFGSLVWLRRRS